MRGYKGFNRNADGTLSCRDFTYKVGKTYKYDGKIELCKSGFHACHELHQTWKFYPNNGNNVFCEVECGGDIIESEEGDGKVVCSEITILREVDMSGVERPQAQPHLHGRQTGVRRVVGLPGGIPRMLRMGL